MILHKLRIFASINCSCFQYRTSRIQVVDNRAKEKPELVRSVKLSFF